MTDEAKVIAGASALVAMSTCVFPFVTGYGTVLFQVVVLSAWSLVASATSGLFADHHHEFVWPVALLLNMVAYAAPLALLRLCLKRAGTPVRVGAVLVWTAFYVASLFVLFPATDGP